MSEVTSLSDINSTFKNLFMSGNRKILMNLVSQHISVDRKLMLIEQYDKETEEVIEVKHKRKRI